MTTDIWCIHFPKHYPITRQYTQPAKSLHRVDELDDRVTISDGKVRPDHGAVQRGVADVRAALGLPTQHTRFIKT